MIIKERELTEEEIVEIISKALVKIKGKVNDNMLANAWILYAKELKNNKYNPQKQSLTEFVEDIIKNKYGKVDNENLIKNYLEGDKKSLYKLLRDNKITIKRILQKFKFISILDEHEIQELIKTCMITAIEKYEPGKGSFKAFFSKILNNALIDKRRKIYSLRAKQVSTWEEFERRRNKYDDVFDRGIIFEYFFKDSLYFNNENDEEDEEKEKESFLSKFTKRELDYLALYLKIPVTNTIAAKAMGLKSERTISNIRKKLKENEIMEESCNFTRNAGKSFDFEERDRQLLIDSIFQYGAGFHIE